MIVPVTTASRGITIPQHPTISKGETMETIDDFAETKVRLDQWTREGQQLIGHVIPSLIEEWNSHREQVQRLRQEIKDKDGEIAALRSEVEELKREGNELAEATSSYLNEINRITAEVARRLRGSDDRVRRSNLRAV
jgi:chromosome segregation ATPase